MKKQSVIDYTLYLVADQSVVRQKDFLVCVEAAICGGVTVVQLREKLLSSRDLYFLAKAMKNITDRYGIPLIINDRLDIAQAVDAFGVHLGQQDLPVKAAREILGTGKIIGASAAAVDEALKAQEEGADYLGVGALYPTNSKKNTRKMTLELLSEIKRNVSIPVVAIGGINHTNVDPVINTGVDGIAVISAILGKEDVGEAANSLRRMIKTV